MLVGKSSSSLKAWPLSVVSQLVARLVVSLLFQFLPLGARCAPPALPLRSSCLQTLEGWRLQSQCCKIGIDLLQHQTLLLSPAGSSLLVCYQAAFQKTFSCLKLTICENAGFYFVQTDKIQVALNHMSVQEQEPCLGWIMFGFRLMASGLWGSEWCNVGWGAGFGFTLWAKADGCG